MWCLSSRGVDETSKENGSAFWNYDFLMCSCSEQVNSGFSLAYSKPHNPTIHSLENTSTPSLWRTLASNKMTVDHWIKEMNTLIE